jgi:hypothetical protein
MTLYQFNMMDEMKQMEAVWNYGIKIGERQDDIHRSHFIN